MGEQEPGGEIVGMPGWAKGGLIGLGVVVVLVAIMLISGHGPWQHFAHSAMPMAKP